MFDLIKAYSNSLIANDLPKDSIPENGSHFHLSSVLNSLRDFLNEESPRVFYHLTRNTSHAYMFPENTKIKLEGDKFNFYNNYFLSFSHLLAENGLEIRVITSLEESFDALLKEKGYFRNKESSFILKRIILDDRVGIEYRDSLTFGKEMMENLIYTENFCQEFTFQATTDISHLEKALDKFSLLKQSKPFLENIKLT